MGIPVLDAIRFHISGVGDPRVRQMRIAQHSSLSQPARGGSSHPKDALCVVEVQWCASGTVRCPIQGTPGGSLHRRPHGEQSVECEYNMSRTKNDVGISNKYVGLSRSLLC